MEQMYIYLIGLILALVASALIGIMQYKKYFTEDLSVEKARLLQDRWKKIMFVEVLLMALAAILFNVMPDIFSYDFIGIVFILIYLSFIPSSIFAALAMYIAKKEYGK